MSPFVKKLALELGKTENEIQKVWEEAKEITSDTFGISSDSFTKREIEYTKEVVREKLGMNMAISVSDFVNSEKTAREFVESSVTVSDHFGIDGPITHKTIDDVEEPEEKTDTAEAKPSKEYPSINIETPVVRQEGKTDTNTEWEIFLQGKKIETVWYDLEVDGDEVKRNLIEFYEFDPRIILKGV